MIRVDVWLPDPAGVLAVGAFGAGALIRIERADLDLAPPYALGAYAEVHTAAVVAATVAYQWWDAAGLGTSYYKWRVSKATPAVPADYSPYSAPFLGTNPAATILPRSYASLDRALALFETSPLNANRTVRLAQALGIATSELIGEAGGRDYFRHPAAGTETWSPGPNDVDGTILHVHAGIVGSLTSLTINGTATTDYVLRGDTPHLPLRPGTAEPAFHVELTIGTFPTDPTLTVVVGARGWAAIPEELVESAAVRARQLIYADPSYSGSSPSDDAYGQPVPFALWPHVLFKFLEREKKRFAACLVG